MNKSYFNQYPLEIAVNYLLHDIQQHSPAPKKQMMEFYQIKLTSKFIHRLLT